MSTINSMSDTNQVATDDRNVTTRTVQDHPTGLTALALMAIGIVDTRWLHSGLTADEWLVFIGLGSAIVSKLSPRTRK